MFADTNKRDNLKQTLQNQVADCQMAEIRFRIGRCPYEIRSTSLDICGGYVGYCDGVPAVVGARSEEVCRALIQRRRAAKVGKASRRA